MTQYTIGIDEVGRGPLAGPVAVGVVCVPKGFGWRRVPHVGDSKAVSEKVRIEVAKNADTQRARGALFYTVAMVSARIIDRDGINASINRSISRALNRIEAQLHRAEITGSLEEMCTILLDGGLCAPRRFLNQHTIIKGDQKEPAIGLASIVAKVHRDRYMTRLATRAAYQPYNFETHKGYGTRAHREAIAHHDLSPEHRKSYCRNIKVL